MPAADISSDLEVEAFRRLYPLQFYERYLEAGVRPDGRPLGRARTTSISIGAIPTADGSALVKLGNTTMIAAVKLEVMAPSAEAPEAGKIAVDFQMPPICSPLVRPGRPVDQASCIAEQLQNIILSSEMVDLRSLCIAKGKAAWMAYLDVCCLDADGSLLDAALLASAASLMHLQLPSVLVTDDGKVLPRTSTQVGNEAVTDSDEELTGANPEDAKLQRTVAKGLQLGAIPVALTCALHKKHLLADPSAEEESILQTTVTISLDLTGRLIAVYKPGGATCSSTATLQDCIALTRARVKEVTKMLDQAFSG